MKTVTPQLPLLCGLFLCLSTVAHAHSDENPIIFSVKPQISNIKCGASPTNALFTVLNQEEKATIWVTPNTIINNDNFPDDLVVIQSADAPGSLTTCDETFLAPDATCDINLIITPESCSNGTILGPIDRVLVVATGTQYKDPTAEIKFAYTRMGAGDDFVILGRTVSNQGGGPVTAQGSVGHTGPMQILGLYNVTEGTFYDAPSDNTNPAVVAAQNSFHSAYQTFLLSNIISGCKPDYELPAIISPGFTCISGDADGVYIDTPGHRDHYFLDGTGDYVFFINNDPDNGTCFNLPVSLQNSCDLTFGSSVKFTYSDPNTPNRVYWIVGNGTTFLTNGARIVGSILAGRGPIHEDPTGTDHTTVVGRLWSKSKEIINYGGTVTRPE